MIAITHEDEVCDTSRRQVIDTTLFSIHHIYILFGLIPDNLTDIAKIKVN